MAGKARGKLSGAALAEFLEKHPKGPDGKFVKKGSGTPGAARALLSGGASTGKSATDSLSGPALSKGKDRTAAERAARVEGAFGPSVGKSLFGDTPLRGSKAWTQRRSELDDVFRNSTNVAALKAAAKEWDQLTGAESHPWLDAYRGNFAKMAADNRASNKSGEATRIGERITAMGSEAEIVAALQGEGATSLKRIANEAGFNIPKDMKDAGEMRAHIGRTLIAYGGRGEQAGTSQRGRARDLLSGGGGKAERDARIDALIANPPATAREDLRAQLSTMTLAELQGVLDKHDGSGTKLSAISYGVTRKDQKIGRLIEHLVGHRMNSRTIERGGFSAGQEDAKRARDLLSGGGARPKAGSRNDGAPGFGMSAVPAPSPAIAVGGFANAGTVRSALANMPAEARADYLRGLGLDTSKMRALAKDLRVKAAGRSDYDATIEQILDYFDDGSRRPVATGGAVASARSPRASKADLPAVEAELAKMRANPQPGDRKRARDLLNTLQGKQLDELAKANDWGHVRGTLDQRRDQLEKLYVGRKLNSNAIDATRNRPKVDDSVSIPPVESILKPAGGLARIPAVGEQFTYQGGMLERLPDVDGQRRWQATTPAGRVLTRDANGHTITDASSAMAALRVAEFDKARIDRDEGSKWRRDLAAVPGQWSYGTRTISGFDQATPQQHQAIERAMAHWVGKKTDTHVDIADGRGPATDPDGTRIAEPLVNAALRNAVPMEGELQADIAALDLALSMSKTERALTLYRGYSNGRHLLPADWQTRDLTGLQWHTPQFVATTGDREVAEGYAGGPEHAGFAIALKLPKGSSALAFPDEVGGLDNEGEIVLPRGMTLRVTKDRKTRNGVRWLDVELVDASKPKPKTKPTARQLLAA